jgi:hypothetical protein
VIFRAIDTDGDFVFGHGGRDYFREDGAISADIKTALLLFLRDAFWAIDEGIDWWALLGGKNPQAQTEILLQTRRTILSREGVLRVNDLTYTLDRNTRALSVQYNIDTIYSGQVREILYLAPLGFTDHLGAYLVDENGNYLTS